jgi:threonine/homoserine/homoserine lactone efflux protein
MLDPTLFAAFVAATLVWVLSPGPIMTLVVANALAHGAQSGLVTVLGSSVGNALLVAAGGLGLTTVLALAAPWFEGLRWAGVLYLAWLGLGHWRDALKNAGESPPPADSIHRGVFWHGLVVAVTNPKTILFYVAFFPQFLDPALPAAPQLWAMGATLVAVAFSFDSLYALLAGRLRPWLRGRRGTRVRHGIAGTLLIATGLGLALARRG